MTITHHKAENYRDKLALSTVSAIRKIFDIGARLDKERLTEDQWVRRLIFMESVSAVPSMVGAMARHLRSLRSGKHDHGMIHHMLNESEN